MHNWGDNWFNEHGEHLYAAINEIESYLRRHHIGICGKEKWGCYRDEYLRFWDGGIYQILFGYREFPGHSHHKGLYRFEWFSKFISAMHRFIRYKIDDGMPDYKSGESFATWYERSYSKRRWKGLCHYMEKTRLYSYIINQQKKHYNYAFQLACKKYPDVTDELISDVDGYEMIKPCKYGNIDGVEIHNRYWKTIGDQ